MDMGANLLTKLRRAKDPNHWDFGCIQEGGLEVIAQLGVMATGQGLIVINTVQADAEQDHSSQRADPSVCA